MLTMRFKLIFFDRPKVQRAADRGTIRALSRAGAFIRTRARSLIRKRKRISLPGDPPSSHIGLLRRLIFFGYDRRRESVVVGPAARRNSKVPRVLEEGGISTATSWDGHQLTERKIKIRARPYMAPALEAERENIPKAWRNVVTRG